MKENETERNCMYCGLMVEASWKEPAAMVEGRWKGPAFKVCEQ